MDSPQSLQALLARRRALAAPLPSVINPPPKLHRVTPRDDPFAVESHGLYTTLPRRVAANAYPKVPISTEKSPSSNLSKAASSSVKSIVPAKISKPPSSRQRRFVTNWTPDMDKVIRKALAKTGWGSWTRIVASGKLPKEYTAKMISNRAKSIGLTKQMFGPALVSTAPRGKV